MSYYRTHVFCCTNRRPDGHARGSCAAKDSERLQAYMKARARELGIDGARINKAGCLDRCELGPCLVVYPEGIWYRCPDEAAIDRVLTEHLQGGQPVAELMLKDSDGPGPGPNPPAS